MKFGDTLTAWMEAAGVSEPGLADAVGCHQGSVRNWKANRNKPSIEQIPHIARALHKRDNDVLSAVLERETVDLPCP